jgi:hypothetical protein
MKTFTQHVDLIESVKYCLEHNTRLASLYRVGSEAYYEAFRLARSAINEGKVVVESKLDSLDKVLIEETDIGEFALYEGQHVPLDSPMIAEENKENVELNKPKRGGNKKYYVYVKNDKGNVVKIEFGDPNLSVKLDDEGARKSFVARHKCDQKKDKTTAGYWACRIPRYADDLGLSSGGNFFW